MPVKGQLSITNMNGVKIFNRQTIASKYLIDVSKLPSGVYLVKFSNERTVQVGKFIKQ